MLREEEGDGVAGAGGGIMTRAIWTWRDSKFCRDLSGIRHHVTRMRRRGPAEAGGITWHGQHHMPQTAS